MSDRSLGVLTRTSSRPSLHRPPTRAGVDLTPHADSEAPTAATVRLPFTIGLIATTASLTGLQIPNYFGGQPLRLATISLLIVIALWLQIPPSRRFDPAITVTGGGLLLLWSWALFIGSTRHAITAASAVGTVASLFALCLLGASLVGACRSERDLRTAMVALALAPAVYATASVLLLTIAPLLPVSRVDATSLAAGKPAGLLHLIGIDLERTQVPTSRSINNFAVVACAGLATCIVVLRTRLTPQALGLGLFLGCAAASLVSDARLPLLIGLGTGVVMSMMRWSHAGRWLLVGALTLPFVILPAARLASGVLGSVSRSSTDVVTLNNRSLIWSRTTSEVLSPSVDHLLGYGAGGQRTSGVSATYAYFFRDAPDPLGTHAHSFVLQTILEIGYLGLAVVLLLLALVVTRIQRIVRLEVAGTGARSLLAGLLVVIACGATESTPTLVSVEALYFVVLAMGGCLTLVATSRTFRGQSDASQPIVTRRAASAAYAEPRSAGFIGHSPYSGRRRTT